MLITHDIPRYRRSTPMYVQRHPSVLWSSRTRASIFCVIDDVPIEGAVNGSLGLLPNVPFRLHRYTLMWSFRFVSQVTTQSVPFTAGARKVCFVKARKDTL